MSSAFAGGWKAYRIDDAELDEPPQLAFYCPSCARREFREEHLGARGRTWGVALDLSEHRVNTA